MVLSTTKRQARIGALVRLTKEVASPEDRDILLDLIEDLATEAPRAARYGNQVKVEFPLDVWINTRRGRQGGILNSDTSILLDDGDLYPNPSAAAEAVLKYKTNGWRVWRFMLDGQPRTLEVLRHWNLFNRV